MTKITYSQIAAPQTWYSKPSNCNPLPLIFFTYKQEQGFKTKRERSGWSQSKNIGTSRIISSTRNNTADLSQGSRDKVRSHYLRNEYKGKTKTNQNNLFKKNKHLTQRTSPMGQLQAGDEYGYSRAPHRTAQGLSPLGADHTAWSANQSARTNEIPSPISRLLPLIASSQLHF